MLTIVMWSAQPLWRIDYEAVAKYSFPSDTAWEKILWAHSGEIHDGSRDPDILNHEFVTGWQICVDYFCCYPNNHPDFPWDYDWISENRPGQHLGGPMKDTIRVSRSIGRKHASAMIKAQLAKKTKDELRFAFYKFNYGYLALVAGYLFVACFGIVNWPPVKRRITTRWAQSV